MGITSGGLWTSGGRFFTTKPIVCLLLSYKCILGVIKNREPCQVHVLRPSAAKQVQSRKASSVNSFPTIEAILIRMFQKRQICSSKNGRPGSSRMQGSGGHGQADSIGTPMRHIRYSDTIARLWAYGRRQRWCCRASAPMRNKVPIRSN